MLPISSLTDTRDCKLLICSRFFNGQATSWCALFKIFVHSSEYSAFWRCVKAGAAYLVTQTIKVCRGSGISLMMSMYNRV
jgi:hypothetical protein